MFSQATPDEQSPDATTLPMASSHHYTHRREVSARLAPPVMYCSLFLANAPLRPSVYYPSISLVLNMIFIRTFCDDLNVVYIFDQTLFVLKSCLLYTSDAADE